jgi:hypothetical protein
MTLLLSLVYFYFGKANGLLPNVMANAFSSDRLHTEKMRKITIECVKKK